LGTDVSNLRVSRRIDDRNAGAELSGTPGQRNAIQQARQKNVSDQRPKRRLLLQQDARDVAANCRQR
jgi:hypothetical protein